MTPLDRKEVTELYGVRAALESYGVRLAVQRSTAADAEQLAELVSQMREAARRGDAGEVIRIDFLIHRFFMELSGNAVSLRTWSTCSTRVRRVLSFRHRSYPDLQEIDDSHLPFLPLMHAKTPSGPPN